MLILIVFGHPTKYALFNPNDRKEKFFKIHIIYDIRKIGRSYCLKILVTRPLGAVLLSLLWPLSWQIMFLP